MGNGAALVRRLTKVREEELSSGEKVKLRPMSAALGIQLGSKYKGKTREELENTIVDPGELAAIVADCLLDEEGSLAFATVEEALALPFHVLVEVAQIIQRQAGMAVPPEGEKSVPLA